MADEIRIDALFDATPITDGMGKASEAVKEAASEIQAAFDEISGAVVPSEQAIQGAGQAAEQFLAQIGGVAEEASSSLNFVANASIQTRAAVEGIGAAAEGVTGLLTALTGLSEQEQAAATGGDQLQLAFARASGGAEQLLNTLGQTSEDLNTVVQLSTEGNDQIEILGTAFQNTAEAATAMAEGLQAAGEGATGLLGQLTGIGQEAQIAGQQFTLFGDIAPPAMTLLQQAEAELVAQEQAVADLHQMLIGLNSQLADTTSQVAQQYELFAEQAGAATVQIVDVATSVANSAGQFELFTQAAADANGQLLLFETTSAEAAAASEALTGQVLSNTEIINALTTVLQNLGSTSQSVVSALGYLGSSQAIAQSTTTEYETALQTVNQALERYNIHLVSTAGALRVTETATVGAGTAVKNLGNSASEATVKISGLNSALGYLSGRALASELGVGQLGFGLGILGRTIAPLNQLFIAAFPIVGVVLMIQVISQLIEKIEHAEDSARRAMVQFDDLALGAERSANSIEIQNLKLEDQINKLEGRPSQNKLALAILEAKQRTDDLIKSLQDGTEKAIDMLEKTNTSLIGFILTGKAPTSGLGDIGSIDKPVAEALSKLAAAREAERLANFDLQENENATTKQAVEMAKQRVAALEDEVEKKARLRLDDVRAAKAVEVERVKSGKAGFLEPKTTEGVEAVYADQERRILNIINLIQQQRREQQLTNQTNKSGSDEAAASIAAEARERDKIISEPDVKAQETAARQLSETKKRDAEETFQAIEANTKLETEQAVLGGELRLQAELDANNKILAARKRLTVDLLDAEQDRYDAEKSALATQRGIIERDEVGPQRIAALKANSAAIENLEREHQNNIYSITSQGENAITTLTSEGVKLQSELLNKGNTEIVRDTKEQVRIRIDDAKQSLSEESAKIKEEADSQLRAVASSERFKITAIKEARDQRIAIIEDETSRLSDLYSQQQIANLESQKEVLEAQQSVIAKTINALPEGSPQIAKLQQLYLQLAEAIRKTEDAERNLDNPDVLRAQQNLIVAIQQSLPEGSPALEQLRQLYDQLSSAMKKASAAQEELNAKMAKQKDAANQTYIDDLTRRYDKLFGTIADRAASGFGEVITRGESVRVALGRQLLELEAEFVQWVLRQVAMYAAGKATEVIVHHTSEAAKTASTATNTATRTGIEQSHTAAVITLDSKKVASHLAHEIAKTVTTLVHEGLRFAAQVAHYIKWFVMKSAELAWHGIVEAAKTAETVGGELARGAVQAAAFVRQVAGYAAHAAAKVFHDVIVSLPFPANVIVAPIAAAGVFAGVMAYRGLAGSAAKGAVLEQDMPIFAHAQEMILPSNISTGLQAMISGGGLMASTNMSTFLSAGNRIAANSTTSSSRTMYVQPEINYHQHGGNGPSRSELHDTIVNAVNIAIRRGQIKGLN